MKTIQQLSTAELWALQNRYDAPPASMEQSIILRGIQAELSERPRSGVDGDTVDDLMMERDSESARADQAEREADRLRDRVADVQQELDDSEAEVQEMRRSIAALEEQVAELRVRVGKKD